MPDFTSNHGQILLALQTLVRRLRPEGLDDTQIEIRRNWLINAGTDGPGRPLEGVTIQQSGEQYDDGTIGTQDIGYLCTITFVTFRQGDSALSTDKDMQWRETVRRRLCDQRLAVTITNETDPREHVCIVSQGRDLTNESKWPNYVIRQLPVTVWLRELPPAI